MTIVKWIILLLIKIIKERIQNRQYKKSELVLMHNF